MKNKYFLIIGIIIIFIIFLINHNKLTNEIHSLKNEMNDLEYDNYAYSEALDRANSNIEDAQSYAWSTYEEMGDALDNLETVNP